MMLPEFRGARAVIGAHRSGAGVHHDIHSTSIFRRRVILAAVFLASTAALCFAQNTNGLTRISDKAETGELVDQVTADGPAAKAGISIHDIITDIEGIAVQSPRQIIGEPPGI